MDEIKNIWLIRHGESKAQTQEELSFDANLSDVGRKQAESLSKVFPENFFDIIYVSPLKRARQTFELSGIKGSRVIFDSRIIEDVPGDSYKAVLPYEKLPAYGLPDIHDAWYQDLPHRIPPFLEDLLKSDSKNIAVFAHAGVMSCLLSCFVMNDFFNPSDFRNYRYCLMNNCAISVLKSGGRKENSMLYKWNSTEHLEGIALKNVP